MKQAELNHRTVVAQHRRQRMRARLLGAAFHLAGEGGAQAVTIDAVTARAGVSRGTFYKYFDQPQDLLAEVGQDVSDILLSTMRPVVGKITDPLERISAGVRLVLSLVQQYPVLSHFLVRSGWPVVDVTTLFREVVGNTLAEGIHSKKLTAFPPELALSVVIGTLMGAMHARGAQGLPVDFSSLTAQAILQGLGVSTPDALALSRAPLPEVDMNLSGITAQLLTGHSDSLKH